MSFPAGIPTYGLSVRLLAVLTVLIPAAVPLRAQAISGSIQGIVTDESGAVIPGAKVSASNTATGLGYSAVSNSAGLFLIPDMRPGNYDFSAEATGFGRYI